MELDASRSERTLGRGTIKKRPRPKAETVRAHGPVEFREWMKSRPCIVPGCKAQPCDAAHIKNGGIARKEHFSKCVALCSTVPATGYYGHHAHFDDAKKSFPAEHGLDMEAEAAKNYTAWLAAVDAGEWT